MWTGTVAFFIGTRAPRALPVIAPKKLLDDAAPTNREANMFHGFDFAVPSLFAEILTALIGGLCALLSWSFVLLDQSRGPMAKIPRGLYPFTFSVVLPLVDIFVDWHLPYDFSRRPIAGTTMVNIISACFLVVSFVLCLFSWIVVCRDSDPATKTLRIGSIVSLIIWMLGFSFCLVG